MKMSKKEKQAYRRGVYQTLGTISVIGFYVFIAIGFMMR